MHDIRITAVLNGYIVNVGCQTLVYQNRATMLDDLGSYLMEPKKTEVRILKEKCFNRELLHQDRPRPIGDSERQQPVAPLDF